MGQMDGRRTTGRDQLDTLLGDYGVLEMFYVLMIVTQVCTFDKTCQTIYLKAVYLVITQAPQFNTLL